MTSKTKDRWDRDSDSEDEDTRVETSEASPPAPPAPPPGHLDSINEPGSHAPPALEPVVPPAITALVPDGCALDAEEFDLVVQGTGFNASSVIHFAGFDEPTTYDEDLNELTTGVKPSLWAEPATVQCSVRNGSVESNIVDFEFTAPEVRSSSRAYSRRDD